MTGTVLILGASGKIGRHAAKAFGSAGWTVRTYDRVAGDMAAQAQGVDVIVNGLNPPKYHDWATILPRITREVIAAARSCGATVIVPGNVYVFGDTPGTWSEATPHRPTTRKGRLREDMECAFAASGVQTIILRAGDFISAKSGDDDIMGMVHMRNIAKGRITSLGDPKAMHAHAYLPDWATAARMLAERRASLPKLTDVNLGGANFTITELAACIEAATSRKVRISRFPWIVMRLLSPFWELARELSEMRYLWSVPHRLDDAKLRSLLPEFTYTDLHTVMLAGLPADIHPDKRVAGRAVLAHDPA